MPVYNEGQRQIDANQNRIFTAKTQEEMVREQEVRRHEAERIKKEGESMKAERWREEQQKSDNRKLEVSNQRKFYGKLSSDLKRGKIKPEEVIKWENSEEKTFEEIQKLNDHDFNVWVERKQLAGSLRIQRIDMKKKELGKLVRDKIVEKRKDNWEEDYNNMSKDERSTFMKEYGKELEGIE